jgi:hypothetical protein
MSVEASGSAATKTQLAVLGFSKARELLVRNCQRSMQSIAATQDSVQKQQKAANGSGNENNRTGLQPALRIEVKLARNMLLMHGYSVFVCCVCIPVRGITCGMCGERGKATDFPAIARPNRWRR